MKHPKLMHVQNVRWAVLGVLLALSLVVANDPVRPVHATAAENVTGWLWNDAIGWISTNDTNPNACATPPCGSYGVNVDIATRELHGYGWNDAVGWICFGQSCAIPACSGASSPVPGPVGATTTIAQILLSPGNAPLIGWAKVCGETPSRGWFSMSCINQGTCSAVPYGVRYNPILKRFGDVDPDASVPPTYSSFAWNKNSDGTGLGWTEFSRMRLNYAGVENCTDAGGIDEDLNGWANCNDLSACANNPSCDENSEVKCSNNSDDNGNGQVDCADTSCVTTAYCVEDKTNRDTCSNAIDDDHDGFQDCADPSCNGAFGCPLVGEPACMGVAWNPVNADICCGDLGDNDSNTQTDCDDANCKIQSQACGTSWLQFKYGNVYSGQNITGQTPTGGAANATYCLTSLGTISGFTSQTGCMETGSQSLALPTASASYQSKLGSLDVAGILNGKYGKVQTAWVNLPVNLDGQVYRVDGDKTINASVLFQNASGATNKGSGLLVVNGGNLTINQNLDYASPAGVNIVRNLASFGVLVLKNGNPAKGNILIDGSVTKIVGAYFAEGKVDSCASGSCNNFLDVFGLMAAREFEFDRTKASSARGAEVITFDGRSVLNPPPGMQDMSKSLPSIKDSF